MKKQEGGLKMAEKKGITVKMNEDDMKILEEIIEVWEQEKAVRLNQSELVRLALRKLYQQMNNEYGIDGFEERLAKSKWRSSQIS